VSRAFLINRVFSSKFSKTPRLRDLNYHPPLDLNGFLKGASYFTDIDECDLGVSTCLVGSTCINTEGSFTCIDPPRLTCSAGYVPNQAKTECVGALRLLEISTKVL